MAEKETYRKLDGSYVTLDEYLDYLEESVAALHGKVNVLEALREKADAPPETEQPYPWEHTTGPDGI